MLHVAAVVAAVPRSTPCTGVSCLVNNWHGRLQRSMHVWFNETHDCLVLHDA